MFKRSTDKYGQSDAPATPYQRAGQVWDDRIGSARVQAKNWRLAALASLALSFLLGGGLLWLATRSTIAPYVVEVDSQGSVRAVGPALQDYRPDDAQIAYHLAAFIRRVRSVSIDPVVVRQNWLKAYDYATDQAAMTLNDYARDNDPFREIGRRSVSVEIASVVRSSADSFDLRWRETVYRNGQPAGSATYTAVLSIVIEPPTTVDLIHKNPLGVYVHGINWSRDLNAGVR